MPQLLSKCLSSDNFCDLKFAEIYEMVLTGAWEIEIYVASTQILMTSQHWSYYVFLLGHHLKAYDAL